MVGTPQTQDFESQSGTAYKTAIDNNMAVCKVIGAAFAPHEKAVPDMNVLVDAGLLFVNGDLVFNPQQTVAFTAPAVNARIDRIVIDKLTGVVARVAGSEAVTPLIPAFPANVLPCCRLTLTVGQTAITNADIVDERVGLGGAESLKEATFAVNIDTGETFNSGVSCRLITNTVNQIVYRISVRGYTDSGAGKGGDPASQNTVAADFTVNHNLGIKQLPSELFALSSSGGDGHITGSLTIFYK